MTRTTLFALTLFCMLTSTSIAQVAIDAQQFDRWIFSSMQTEAKAREQLDKRIDMEISRLEKSLDLDEDQKAKIRLAGNGDIKRFFDDVESARDKLAEMGDIDQARMNEAYQLAQPLSQRLNKGLFGKQSLLEKVAYGSLDAQQAAALKERRDYLRQRKLDSVIRVGVAGWGRKLALTTKQRSSLTKMIKENVTIKYPDAPYATMLLGYQLGKCSDDAFDAILDEQQLKGFRKISKQAEAMRPFLIQQGLLEDE